MNEVTSKDWLLSSNQPRLVGTYLGVQVTWMPMCKRYKLTFSKNVPLFYSKELYLSAFGIRWLLTYKTGITFP